MNQNVPNHEELEHQAMEAAARQEEEKTEYVERPKGQRILAWVLFGFVAVGVLLYYGWISGILHS